MAKIRYRLNRGFGWFDYLRYVAYIYVATLGIEKSLVWVYAKLGWVFNPDQFSWAYMYAPPAVFIISYVIGYVDEKYGFWKIEAIYGSKNLNPFMDEINNKIISTNERVNQIIIKLDELKVEVK